MFRRAAIAAIAVLISPLAAEAAGRYALVIGNSDYVSVPDLPNPRNDAADIADALRRLGFEVELKQDQDLAGMISALGALRKRSYGADQALVYYAGHGIEIDRANYLIPVDASLRSDLDVEYEAAPLSLAMQAVSGAGELGLVVLDACRDNPFLKAMNRNAATRSIGRGLGAVEPQGATLVAYAARDGTVALDGTGRNSPFAGAFLRGLGRDGVEIGKLFRQIRDEVIAATDAQQEPFLYGSLPAQDIFLNPPDRTASLGGGGAAVPNSSGGLAASAALEAAFWQSISQSRAAGDFEDYLARFPDGVFRSLAERRLASLTGKPAVEETERSPRDEAAPQPRVAMTRTEIREAQERLSALGIDVGAPDGIEGPRTRAALRRFQAAEGLEVSARLDDATQAALRRKIDDAAVAAWRREQDLRAEAARAAAESRAAEAARREAETRAEAEAAERRRQEATASADAETRRRAEAEAAAAREAADKAAAERAAAQKAEAERKAAVAALRPPERPIFGHTTTLLRRTPTRLTFETTESVPVRASLAGTVTAVDRDGDGLGVTVTSPEGPVLRYSRLRFADVRVGETVGVSAILGRTFGTVGEGRVFTGPPQSFHLVILNGAGLPDPRDWFR